MATLLDLLWTFLKVHLPLTYEGKEMFVHDVTETTIYLVDAETGEICEVGIHRARKEGFQSLLEAHRTQFENDLAMCREMALADAAEARFGR